jgi:hypothetical protein
MVLVIAASVPIANRPGLFAVVRPETAKTIREGYMKVFERNGEVVIETITRARKPISAYDPCVRIVCFAIDGDGRLVTETG